MWARTLCPLSSSTRKKALGSDSTTVPSISMAPSFLGMYSALRSVGWWSAPRRGWFTLLGGKAAPPGSTPALTKTAGRDNREGLRRVHTARMREPRGLTTGNPADGPETSVLDPRHQREPPTCMTPPGPRLFPVALYSP